MLYFERRDGSSVVAETLQLLPLNLPQYSGGECTLFLLFLASHGVGQVDLSWHLSTSQEVPLPSLLWSSSLVWQGLYLSYSALLSLQSSLIFLPLTVLQVSG